MRGMTFEIASAAPLHEAIQAMDLRAVHQALADLGAQAVAVLNHQSDDKAYVPPLIRAARQGSQAMAAMLLEAGGDIDVRDVAGRTPLFRAYAASDLAMASFLTARGADIHAKNVDGSRIFDIALTCCDVALAQVFMAAGEPLQYVNAANTSTLHRACAAGPDLAAFVLEQTTFRLDQVNRQGLRPVDFAKSLDVLDFAVQRQPGLVLNAKLPNGDHSIHRFAKNGLLDIVAHLLDIGANPSLVGKEGNSVLHQAVASGNVALARLLLDRGAALEARNSANHRPLHWAASAGRLDMVKLLVERGAKLDVKTNTNFIIVETRTPLYLAIERGHLDVATYLVEQGAGVDEVCDANNRTALTAACWDNHVDLVRLLLARGASPNGVGDKRALCPQPLANASGAEVVELLLQAGADINATDGQQKTALHWLAELPPERVNERWGQGRLGAIRALLAHGADAQARADQGWTPVASAKTRAVAELLISALPHSEQGRKDYGKELFHRARSCSTPDELDTLMALLEQATLAEVNFSEYDGGETVLHRLIESAGSTRDEAASLTTFRRIIEWLLRKGARLDAMEAFRFETPLHAVCRASMWRSRSEAEVADWLAIARLMVARGADVNARNKHGSQPLDLVQHAPFFQLLKAHGAQFGGLNEALFHALDSGRFDLIDLLLAEGASLETRHQRFESGDTLLLHAARRNDVPALAMLQARGARGDTRGADGMTALHVACAAGAFAAVRELAGPVAPRHLDAQDDHGRTPLCLLLSCEPPHGDRQARADREETALWLAESGASVEIPDKDGKSPLSYTSTKKLAAALQKKAKATR
jgi:ankyrin repeat protein